MPELSPAVAALIKVFSLGYLLTLLGLGTASLLWRALRPRLAPGQRADSGFTLLAGSWLLNSLLAAGIWWGVVNFKILMTTNYFHQLMYGGWANGITGTGLMVCGVSLMLLAWGWQRGSLPQRLEDDGGLGTVRDPRGRELKIRPASGVATAALVGVIKPEVWVNAAYWQGLGPMERDLALAHELTHLRRGDNLRKLLLACIGGLFAVLPGARGWAAGYEQDSELAVDDACRHRHDEGAYRGLIAGALDFILHGGHAASRPGAAPATARAALLSGETAWNSEPGFDGELPVHSSLGKPESGSSKAHAALLERLQILARPRFTAPVATAVSVTVLLLLLSAAHSIALLTHPLPRCLLACYLGY